MHPLQDVSFEDTEVAFAYKSDADLRRANLIFSLVNHPWMSSIATGLVRLSLQLRLPVEAIIRETAFRHFCGGESIAKSEKVIATLARYGVGTILDYSVEGEKSESGFDATMEEILKTIDMAHHSKDIPFCVFKVTGVGSSEILGKISQRKTLSAEEQAAYERTASRVNTICSKASSCGVPVLVDAEESWIQDPIDNLADEMMARYNRERAIVYNTYQMYRTSSMDSLAGDFARAEGGNYFIGAKLVRGAYMEKERERAESEGYPSPVHPDKPSTDAAFDAALQYCIERSHRVYTMCGSHNEKSSALLTRLMAKHNLSPSDKRVWFAQLYGMSDHISFNLARAGYNVAKYVPYGPVRAVMPYLLRRAEENTSVAGQSSRELTLIRTEVRRRRR